MNVWKRSVAAVVLAAFVIAALPKPAAAVSTASEIRIGQDAARHIDNQNQLMEDPVMNAWATSIVNSLAQYRARPDIHYSIKIVDTNDINAFSLPGGFVYVNFGLMNYVDSDDELAGVLGHEIGHVERRHAITLDAKAQVLDILNGVLSIASPFVYRFGNLVGDLALYKMSRNDELQADQYGLLLMTRDGYDPNAMVSFQDRLGHQFGFGGGGLDKYFEDHPDAPARIAHLEGYPELSKTNAQQMLAQATHDEDEGRYAYALGKINNVLKLDPTNQLAMLHKGQIELALGSFDLCQTALEQVASSQSAGAAGQSAAQRVLADAPEEMTLAGLGDCCARFVAYGDWYLASALGLVDYYSEVPLALLDNLDSILLGTAARTGERSREAEAVVMRALGPSNAYADLGALSRALAAFAGSPTPRVAVKSGRLPLEEKLRDGRRRLPWPALAGSLVVCSLAAITLVGALSAFVLIRARDFERIGQPVPSRAPPVDQAPT